MASTPDAFNDPGAMVARVQQQYQGWADGGQQPYDRGLMGIGRIKSLALYNITINRVRDIVARFNRFDPIAPVDAAAADDI